MSIKDSDLFRMYYNSFSIGKTGLKVGEFVVFLLIVAFLEENGNTTQFEVLKANKTHEGTARNNIRALILKGFLSSSRSGQYFSRSYLSLTEKGLLLKAHIRKTLLQGLK